MTSAGTRGWDDGGPPATPPLPAPLVAPTIGLLLGVWLSDASGEAAAMTRGIMALAPFVLAIGVFGLTRGANAGFAVGNVRRWSTAALLAGLALPVGFTRHQLTEQHPPNHVTHVLAERPVLTWLTARVVTPPRVRPGARYNPFVPFHPPKRTTFVASLEQLVTTDPPRPIRGNVRVTVKGDCPPLAPGQVVGLTGELYTPQGPQNPGARDWRKWFTRQGIYAGLSVDGEAHIRALAPPSKPPRYAALSPRIVAARLLLEPLATTADPNAIDPRRLIQTMVLGQRSAADRQINDAFQRVGGMHFLAVSGFHVGLLAWFVWSAARFALPRNTRAAALATIVVTLAYATITEPNAPVLRATTIVVLLALARCLDRPHNVWNALALAAAGLVLYHPPMLFQAGYQLSFVMVIGIVLVVPLVPRVLIRLWHWLRGRPAVGHLHWPEARSLPELIIRRATLWVWQLAVVSCCAWLLGLPLTILHFEQFAPWGAVGVMVITPLVIATIILSLATVGAGLLEIPATALPGQLLAFSTNSLIATVEWLGSHLKPAIVATTAPPIALVLLTYLVVFVVAWHALRSARRREANEDRLPMPTPTLTGARLAYINAGGLVLLAWVAWLVLPVGRGGPGYAVHVLSVGSGGGILITSPGAGAIVYDVGTINNSDAGATVAQAARAVGVRRLREVLISHANFDHYSGLPTLLRELPTRRWLISAHFLTRGREEGPVHKLLDLLPPRAPPPETLAAGAALALGEARLTVLWPPTDLSADWRANDRALVVRMDVAGRSVLLTGDIDAAGMSGLLARERAGEITLRADVLVAPHHGAVRQGVTDDFYAAVSPACVIISSHRPRPKLHPIVYDVLGPTARIVNTSAVGAVTVRIRADGRLGIETPYGP